MSYTQKYISRMPKRERLVAYLRIMGFAEHVTRGTGYTKMVKGGDVFWVSVMGEVLKGEDFDTAERWHFDSETVEVMLLRGEVG